MNKLVLIAGIAVMLFLLSVVGYCVYLLNVNHSLRLELSSKPSEIRTETKTIVYDSTRHYVFSKERPLIVNHYYPAVDSLPKSKSDTVQVIQDYYSVVAFRQSYKDSSLSLTINDTVSRNRIIGRSYSYSLLKPTAYISATTFKAKPRRGIEIHAGLAAGYGSKFSQPYLVSPYVVVNTKGNSSLLVSYDLLHQAGSVGVAIKLTK